VALLGACKPDIQKGEDFDHIDFFRFNGWDDMNAFYIDSLGNVSKLRINHSVSSIQCFKLTPYQLDLVKLYIDSLYHFQASEGVNPFLNCADCPIDNIVLTKKGVQKSYDSEKAYVPSSFYGLAAIIENGNFKTFPCKDFDFSFHSSKGYEELFVRQRKRSN
jgi:hypothetical protein